MTVLSFYQVANDLIYVFGGFNGIDVLSNASVYNPETNQWKELPEMIIRRKNAVSVRFNSCQSDITKTLCVIGGWDENTTLRVNEIFNLEEMCWTFDSMTRDLSFAICGFKSRPIALSMFLVQCFSPTRSWSSGLPFLDLWLSG